MRSKTVLIVIGAVLLAVAVLAFLVLPTGEIKRQEADTSVPAQRQIEAENFNRLVFKGSLNVNVTQGDAPSVVVSGTEASLSRLRSQVSDGVLYMELEERGGIRIGRATTVDIVMPALAGLVVNGAGNVKLTDMTLDTVALQINGAGNVEASGTCNQMTIGVSGAGNVEARDLKCHKVTAEMAGAGNMNVFADESVQTRLLGVGDIDIYGNPKERGTEKLGIGSITYHAAAE